MTTEPDTHADRATDTGSIGERESTAKTDGGTSEAAPVETAETEDEETADRDVLAYLQWGAIAGLGLVALVAVFRLYFAASRAIEIWISADFQPLFQAVFNLVVLLLAAAGIVVFARRLR